MASLYPEPFSQAPPGRRPVRPQVFFFGAIIMTI